MTSEQASAYTSATKTLSKFRKLVLGICLVILAILVFAFFQPAYEPHPNSRPLPDGLAVAMHDDGINVFSITDCKAYPTDEVGSIDNRPITLWSCNRTGVSSNKTVVLAHQRGDFFRIIK